MTHEDSSCSFVPLRKLLFHYIMWRHYSLPTFCCSTPHGRTDLPLHWWYVALICSSSLSIARLSGEPLKSDSTDHYLRVWTPTIFSDNW